MRKPYSKPMVTFEEYSLDMPIAAGCDPDYIDIAKEFEEQQYIQMGYFNANEECSEYLGSSNDKLCYYTVSTQLFTS